MKMVKGFMSRTARWLRRPAAPRWTWSRDAAGAPIVGVRRLEGRELDLPPRQPLRRLGWLERRALEMDPAPRRRRWLDRHHTRERI